MKELPENVTVTAALLYKIRHLQNTIQTHLNRFLNKMATERKATSGRESLSLFSSLFHFFSLVADVFISPLSFCQHRAFSLACACMSLFVSLLSLPSPLSTCACHLQCFITA